jgi:hypothetical protein
MKRLLSILALVSLAAGICGQSPEKMSYQAVIRDSENRLVTNKEIGIRISILQGNPTGTIVYQETYDPKPQTNANGLVSLKIGGGIPVSGSFSDIVWTSGPYFLKSETDPTGSSDYTITGTSEILSVPYAFSAEISNHAIHADSSVYAQSATNMQLNDLRDVNTTPALNDVMKWNGTTWVSAPDSLGGLTLPFSGSLTYLGAAFEVTNYGRGPAIKGVGGVLGLADSGSMGVIAYADTGTSAIAGFFNSASGTALYTGEGNVILSQYTQLGDNQSAPFIRMKKVTGTTAATLGGTVSFAHGLDATKIVGVTVLVRGATNSWVPPSYIPTSSFVYNYFFDGAIFYIINSAGNSAFLLSKPYSVLFTYEQ